MPIFPITIDQARVDLCREELQVLLLIKTTPIVVEYGADDVDMVVVGTSRLSMVVIQPLQRREEGRCLRHREIEVIPLGQLTPMQPKVSHQRSSLMTRYLALGTTVKYKRVVVAETRTAVRRIWP